MPTHDQNPLRRNKRDILMMSRMCRGFAVAGALLVVLCLPLLILPALHEDLGAPLDAMNLLAEFSAPMLLIGLACMVLGGVGAFVVNVGAWREVRQADQARLEDLSGRTRFGWGKKKYKFIEDPEAEPEPPRLPCVLPPPRSP